MTNFIGTYDCTIDSKGRVMVPLRLKNQLLPFADRDFIVKGSLFSSCLELYTMDEWNRQVEKLEAAANLYDEDYENFKRAFYLGHKTVNLDKSGRILLTKDLIAYSGISKDVTMASLGNKIEIWDTTAYQKKFEQTDVKGIAKNLAERFARMRN